MDNAVITVKQGQNLTIIVEGYEAHAASFDYDDVFGLMLNKAQSDLADRRREKMLVQQKLDADRSQYSNSGLNSQAQPYHYVSSALGSPPRQY